MTLYHKDFELGWLWGAFHNEQVRLLKAIDKKNSNEANRTYVRSFFSMIEGITFRIRQILLERQKQNKIDLNLEQIIALTGTSVEIESNGNLKTRPKYHDFKSLTLFTYKLYCQLYNKLEVYERFLSDNRFVDFKAGVSMRNRITHPKSGEDIYINGEDLQKVISAGEWHHEFLIEIFTGDLLQEEEVK